MLVTTLTKRLAEDLSAYIQEAGIRGRYLHSEIQTLERVEILYDLRKGEFDVLVGINLLREGLDLPEVSLVAILDADKAGFLRSETSLIQTIGRAARNVNAKVILYADSDHAGDAGGDGRDRAPPEDPDEVQRRSTASRRRPSRRRSAPASSRKSAPAGRPQPPSATTKSNSTRPKSSGCWRKKCSKPPRTWSSSGRPSCATS